MKLVQWKKIFKAISNNLDKSNVIEKIKEELAKEDKYEYGKWKQDGFDVNYSFQLDDVGQAMMLLHLAAEGGYVDIAKHLIEQEKINLNAVDSGGDIPLHCAAGEGHLDIVKLLIEKEKTNVNAVDSGGYTPLHCAASEGHLDIVKLLMNNGANVNAVDRLGWTPLHWAASKGHLEIVNTLVVNGANVNSVDLRGQTPLYLANSKSYKDIIKSLTEAMDRQLFKQSLINGCYMAIFGTGIAISFFTAGMIEVSLASIVGSVAIVLLASLAISCITYRPSIQVDKVENISKSELLQRPCT